MSGPAADRNLLFGVLAVQMDLVTRDDLIDAMNAWVLDKARPLGAILAGRGSLSERERALLDGLVDAHLARHSGDPERSLAAVRGAATTREGLARIGDVDVQASLAHLPIDPTEADAAGATLTFAANLVDDGARFRILRPHARGNLGEVFVAHDRELRREVALKEIQDYHAARPESRARFVLEAEITGGLEHPGIVPVYGLGFHGDGRPYYAMRFVRGETLKEAIARFHGPESGGRTAGERGLELRRLLGHFLAACNAIAYAHSRGVLHRDLKPANILLGPFGETLVVDWGLAKPVGRPDVLGDLDGEGTLRPTGSGSAPETQAGTALGTPGYMSPEQAAGDLDRLGPRGDVYSLGATLYHLLTGRPPFEGPDLGELLRRIGRGDFAPPRVVNPDVPRALQAVCLKAMATRPEDRYAGARDLADDVEHWLADEPVAAWREPWWMRLRRDAVRHRSLLAALAIIVPVALICLSSVAVHERMSRWEVEQSNQDLQIARDEMVKALDRAGRREELALKAIDRFRRVVQENPELSTRPELAPLRRRLLEQPREFYTQLRDEAQSGPVGPDPNSSRTLAHANFNLAWIAAETGTDEQAMRSYQDALAVIEPLTRSKLGQSWDTTTEAMILNNLGVLQVNAGRYTEARASLERALAIREATLRRSPGLPSARSDVALSRHNLGWLESKLSRVEPALRHFREARALRESLLAESPTDQSARYGLATTCGLLGRLLMDTDHLEEAREPIERSRALLEPLVRDHPANSGYRVELANTLFQLGTLEQKAMLVKNTGAGLDHFERCLDLREALARDQPGVASHRNDLTDALLAIGSLHRQMKQYDRAEPPIRRAVTVREDLVSDQPGSFTYRNNLSAALMHLGLLLVDSGRAAEAIPHYDRAIALLETLRASTPDDLNLVSLVAGTHNNRGLALAKLGRHDDALPDFRRAIELERNCLDLAPEVDQYRYWLHLHHRNLGKSLRALGRLDESYASALEGYRLRPDRADSIYDYACDLSLLSGLVGGGRDDLSDAERARRRDYADRAVAELRRSIDAGFRAVRHLTHDPDFDPIAGRPDFRELVDGLIFGGDPFAAD